MDPSDYEKYGTVYFIGHGKVGPVKIGFTADRDPMPRLRQLQTGAPEDLNVLGTIEAYASIERKIQTFLAPHNVRGEWFEREAALLVLQRLKNRSMLHRSDFVDQLLSLEIADPRQSDVDDDEEPLHVQIARDILWDIVEQLSRVNTAQALPFRAWLLTQTARDHPTGDLARDVSRDTRFPPVGSLADYLFYVKSKTYNSAVVRATVEAWIECDMVADGLATREKDTFTWTDIP